MTDLTAHATRISPAAARKRKRRMKIFGHQWSLVWWKTYDHVVTENGSLRRHLLETQRELAKHKLLLARLGNADEETTKAFERARESARGSKEQAR